MPPARRRVAVVGAGWAGLAAAVGACEGGHAVSVFEMAPRPGGRSCSVDAEAGLFDNGQHILIGAYLQTLALMRRVGADPQTLLWRQPLALTGPDGRGLVLPAGAPVPAFLQAVLAHPSWSWRERLALLGAAARWRLAGFRCAPELDVARLCAALPRRLHEDLIEPLCVAALNTPSSQASAQVFLRVLRDALFAGPGAADLLLPRAPLQALLPGPAARWLQAQGATIDLACRVMSIESAGRGWRVDGIDFDAVVLATSARESARLVRGIDAGWAALADALDYQPIVTVWLRLPGRRLVRPMVALPPGADAPAQFVFDLGQLAADGSDATDDGLMAFVVSGAAEWVARGRDATVAAVQAQAARELGGGPWALVHAATEKRATFACRPGLRRPHARIAAGLLAAGDYVEGPYPATLEGAVRSGLAAAAGLEDSRAPAPAPVPMPEA